MSRFRSDVGAAAVEFAIIVLPLVVLVAGIIDFGLGLNQQLSLSAAAREGARIMAVENNPGAASSQSRTNYPDGTTVSIKVIDKNNNTRLSCDTTNALPANLPYTVTVTMKHDLSSVTGMNSTLFSGKTLTGEGVMRCGG